MFYFLGFGSVLTEPDSKFLLNIFCSQQVIEPTATIQSGKILLQRGFHI